MVERRKIERAIVLAAGTGSRLVSGEAYPKPMKLVSGVPLLVRILRSLQSEGVREAVIVTGHMGDQIKRALLAEPSIGLSLTFVENDLYSKKNGVSLLAAREHVVEGTLLTMADHLYSPEIVRRLRAMDLPRGSSALAVDYDSERCFDIDDATNVRIEHGRITDIGKELESYTALDTGVFRIGPELTTELAAIFEQHGDCSLSDGVRALAKKGRFFACDAGDARWIDVDTPAALQRAEAMLRVFGDHLGDEPASAPGRIDPESIELFAPSWVRAAQPYKEDHFELADKIQGVTRMMSNESPFHPSQRVLDAVMNAALRGNLYPASARDLRDKIGKREGLTEEHVLLGAGSAELIDLVIRTFVAPGEEVLLSVPTFSMYEARTRTAGGLPVLVPMTPDSEVDVPALIARVTERTKVIFLCTPNNPTGSRVAEAGIRRVLRLGLPTVIDEAYHDLGDPPDSLAYLLAEQPNAIFLRTFSKGFGLAGMRLGFALAHPAAIRLLSRVKIPWNISSLTIAAATAVLEDVAEQDERLRALRQGRAYLVRELGSIPGVSVMPSEANFVLIDVARCGVSAE
ncbi:MAG TPA: aminotransferase class I/II-fold pyridoxal phosphate-dependent enzyme, partial [Polyangiaceae bacterium]|nr:aminotransferase class I/II-fold pyridoxal phosphate-dependent enzyme [Polyangiaceae bacterium]